METRSAYNEWASQYDSNENRTRDLEGLALRDCLSSIPFVNCLELGCGTGKNTAWLAERAGLVLAVDFSEEMLARAREKHLPGSVRFVQADINQDWAFTADQFDLVIFSLVLEHIEDLDTLFLRTRKALRPGGMIYIGELHPFRQYQGSKARFDTERGRQEATCYTHHISDFLRAAEKQGIMVHGLREYFDDNDRNGIPRILSIVLKKS